ncbi:hypothetical protein BDB00DRAFT_809846 [Zychaea mexicana]|uniref:uncharacterized protein n=1 Tax=Zychaea mexicana TaxID=64656 RepID=UPI0022FDE7C0|nr:uncharacterized protein BDB00DRAFT_809846 [Zychaea mexicana]KAI9496297.1 hypothetical protein BDB00DRAFT_809846 [Zychaea mexicana]
MSSGSYNPTNSSADDGFASIHNSFKESVLQPPSAILPSAIKDEWSSSSPLLLADNGPFAACSSTSDIQLSPAYRRTPESMDFCIEFIPPEATPRSIARTRRLSSILQQRDSYYTNRDDATRAPTTSARSPSSAAASSSSLQLPELQDARPHLLRGPFEPGPLCLEDHTENESMQEIINFPDDDAMSADE